MAFTRQLAGLIVGLSVVATIAAGCVDGGLFSSDSLTIDNRTTRPVVITLGSGFSVLLPACGHVAFDPRKSSSYPSAVIGHGASVPPDAVQISHELDIPGYAAIHVWLWITPDGVRDALNEPLPSCGGEPPAA